MSDSRPNRILLTGGTGQIGRELRPRLSLLGEVAAPDRTQLDLSSENAIRSTVRSLQPSIVINAAAYTAVDRAETDRDTAMLTNGNAPGILAEEAKRVRAIFIHYSTDYVFDGRKSTPYLEEDLPNPLNEYGRSKLFGEQNVRAAGGAGFILRTSWVYAPHGSNFVLTMLRLGSERESLRIVADQTGSPTSASAVADATMAVLKTCRQHPTESYDFPQSLAGTYHATCAGETTWYEFAKTIFDEVKETSLGPNIRVKELVPIPGSEYPSAAQRPCYSVMSNDKRMRVFGLQPPSWQECLREVIQRLALTKAGSTIKDGSRQQV